MLRFFNRKLHNRKGFTLIELIVVIAILGILAVIAVPRLGGFTEAAKETNDEELAAVTANAAAMYIASNSDKTVITTGTASTSQVLVSTANLYAAKLIQQADDSALLASLKSVKYTTGTQAVAYTWDATNGTITVAIGGTVKATSVK
jgi:prepilin-type N-terminal cleavage/methylation domain-containing protein